MAPVLNTKPLSSHTQTNVRDLQYSVQLPPVAESPKTAREASVGVCSCFQFDIKLIK